MTSGLHPLGGFEADIGVGLARSRGAIQQNCRSRDDAPSSVMKVYWFGEDAVEDAVWMVLSVAGACSVLLGILGYCLAE
jgi:hypothetical protein